MSVATKEKVQRTRRTVVHSGQAQPIADRLAQLLARIKHVILLRGLLGVAAALLGTVLALMGLDALVVIESTAVRTAISLAGVAVVAAAAWWFVVRPLRRRVSLTSVARMVEMHHPELQERVSSALELLSANNDRGSRGSEQLIAALAAEASIDVRTFDPRREVGLRTVRPYMIVAGVLACLFFFVVAIWPRQSATLLLRLLSPGSNSDRIQALALDVSPGDDKMVPLGDPLTISVRAVSGRLAHPQVRLTDSTEHEVRHAMEASGATAGSEAFAYRCPAVLESFQFRVQDGAALTRVYKITAVPRPKIGQVRVRYEFPSYTGLPTNIETELQGPVVAPVGTRLQLTALCDRAIAQPTLTIGNNALTGQAVANSTTPAYGWSLIVEKDQQGVFTLADAHGIASQPAPLELKAIADQPPQVRITEPAKSHVTLRPTERMNLHFAVEEDFGLSIAELLISVDGAESTSQTVSLPKTNTPAIVAMTSQRRLWTGMAPLDLSAMQLSQARKMTVRVRVRDNRPAPAGAQVAISPPLEITLDQAATEYGKQKADTHVADFADVVRPILDGLKEALPVVEAVAAQPASPGQLDEPAREKMKSVGKAIEKAIGDLGKAADQFKGTLVDPLVPELKEIADQPLAEAGRDIQQAQTTDNPAERQPNAKGAAAKIAQAAKQLQSLIDKLPQHKDDLGRLAAIEDLYDRQEKVLENIEQDLQQPPTTPEAPDWKKNEADIANQLKELQGKEPVDPNEQPSDTQQDPKDSNTSEKESKDGKQSEGMKPGQKDGASEKPSDKEGEGSGKGKGKGKGKGMEQGEGMGTEPSQPGNGMPSPASSLAQAQSQASQASMAPTASQAQGPAANALAALGQAASAKAQGMGICSIGNAPSPGPPGPSRNGPAGPVGAQSASAGGPTATHPDIRVPLRSKDWIVWQGRIAGNRAVDATTDTPLDFQDIVSRYFSALSQQGVETTDQSR